MLERYAFKLHQSSVLGLLTNILDEMGTEHSIKILILIFYLSESEKEINRLNESRQLIHLTPIRPKGLSPL